jgi:hypothetical protein
VWVQAGPSAGPLRLQLLDSHQRVIVETEANLVVGFDTARFAAKTAAAAAALRKPD